jgi:hypothetical protein
MRKILLASAATLGMVGTAGAQPAAQPAAQPVATTAPTAWGVNGVPIQPQPFLGGNNLLNSNGATPPDGPTTPTPGTVVIHLNGRVWFYMSVNGNGGADRVTTATSPLPTPGFHGQATAQNKNGNFGYIGYARLYPGFDAMATNGLRYGGIMEIRQNFTGASGNPPLAGSTSSSGASGYSCASTLYFRREALYVGANNVGIFRFGQDDGPISQFEAGVTTFQNFDSGNFNGDSPDLILGNVAPTWPFWTGIGAEYAISKAVYMSPQIYGFDFGFSFAPNVTANIATNCAAAGTGCVALTSSSVTSDAFRPRNMYEAIARYQGVFGGLGIYAMGGYVGSGHVQAANAGVPGFGPNTNGFSVGDAGLALTFAGLTVGGHVIGGNMNGQVALQPVGGAHAIAWIAGVQYAVGPLTVGASYYNYQSQGSAGLATGANGGSLLGVTQRSEGGPHIGGTWSIAPGLAAYAEYGYFYRRQGDFNFVTGAVGTANNSVNGQVFILGTRVAW